MALLDVFNVLQSCLLTPFKQTNIKMIKAYVMGQTQTSGQDFGVTVLGEKQTIFRCED